MKEYINISTGFAEHQKTRDFVQYLGKSTHIYIIFLWCWLIEHDMEDGVLIAMNYKDIEHATKWDGETGKLFEALVNTGWLVLNSKGNFVLHGINSASLENF